MNVPKFVPVSVIIPCYKSGGTIRRAVASVMAQSILPAEIIIVDDASGDASLDILKNMAAENPTIIRLICLAENVGAASARNAGWAASTQPYIAFLDSDDAWHPDKLKVQYQYMASNPDVCLSGHGHRILNIEQTSSWPLGDVAAVTVSKWQMLLSNRFVTPSAMVRRDIAERFIDGQRYMEDHMLWLSIVCSGKSVSKLSIDLTALYKPAFGSNGLSSQIWLMERGDLANYWRIYKKNWIGVFLFSFLVVFSCVKYLRRLLMFWGYLRWRA